MRPIVILAAAASILQPLWPQETRPARGPVRKPATRPTAVVEGAVGRRLDARMAQVDKTDGGFCGAALVAVGGRVLLEKAYGVADAAAKKPMAVDALWDWASISKQFTAAAILKLEDQEKLDVDDPVRKFYPDAREEQAGVTLRQLLTHTSGIEPGFKKGWSFDMHSRESFEKLHTHLPLESNPGEKFQYNNSGYSFLAAVVERVSKRTFETFCIEELFKPAGMKDAAFIGVPSLDLERVPKIDRGRGFPEPGREARRFAYGNTLTWGYRGCGGAVMTVRDMYLWDRALRGDTVLSKAAKEELYKPALDNYALGWKVTKSDSGTAVFHSGGVRGVVSYLIRGLEEDYCIAIVYSYPPKSRPEPIAEDLLRIARKKS